MDKSVCCRSTVRCRPQFCRNADHVLTLKRQFRCWLWSPGDRAFRISNYPPSGAKDGIQTGVVTARPPPQSPLEPAGTTFRVDRNPTTLWVEFTSQRPALTRHEPVTERSLRGSGANPAREVVVPFDKLHARAARPAASPPTEPRPPTSPKYSSMTPSTSSRSSRQCRTRWPAFQAGARTATARMSRPMAGSRMASRT